MNTSNKSGSSHAAPVKKFTQAGDIQPLPSDKSDNVRALNAVPYGPVQATVEQIEGLLLQAKAGELLSIAYVGEMREGSIMTGVPGQDTLQSPFAMLGGIERLKLRFYELQIEGI